MNESPYSSTSSSAFAVINDLDFSHSRNCEWLLPVIVICNFLMTSDVDHLFMCIFAICISSLERSVQIFCSSLNWITCFLILAF